MKKVEPDCLLDLDGTALRTVLSDILDAHVAAAPEIVQILLLRGQQLLESLDRYAIQSPLSATAEFLSRSRIGGMVDNVLRELDRTGLPRFDGERDLTEVVGVDSLVDIRARTFKRVLGRTYHHQRLFSVAWH